MVIKEDQQRVKALLKDTITLLCRNGLHYQCQFSIEALIGITLDEDQVFLVNINETIRDGIEASKKETPTEDPSGSALSPSVSDSSDRSRPRSRDSGIDQQSHRDTSGSSSGRSPGRLKETPSKKKRPSDSESPSRKRHAGEGSDDISDAETDTLVKMEEDLPDGSSFKITTGDAESGNQSVQRDDSSLHTPPHEGPSGDSDDDIVVIKDEVLSDSELQLVQGAAPELSMTQPGLFPTSIPSGRTEPLPGSSSWASPQQGQQSADPSQIPVTTQVGSRTQASPAKPQECSECHKRFVSEQGFRIHMKMHKGIYPYTCAVCRRGYTATHALRNHMKIHDQNISAFKCPSCGQWFEFKKHLNTHLQDTRCGLASTSSSTDTHYQ